MLDRVALVVVMMITAVLRALPARTADCAAWLITRAVFYAIPRSDKAAMRNLETVFPEMSRNERRTILQRSYKQFAKNLTAFARIPDLDAAELEEKWDYSEWDEASASVREHSTSGAVILATMHFGLFEQIMQAHKVLTAHRWAALARGFGLPQLDKWWKARREQWGCVMFDRKGGYRELEHHLSSGTDTAVLFDQNVKRNHAVFVDFFGVQAATTKALFLAAERSGAQIVFAVSAEYAPGRWKVVARAVPPELLKEGTRDERMVRVMKKLHEFAEEAIREYPDHWFWVHRRFKTRPAGEAENFYD